MGLVVAVVGTFTGCGSMFTWNGKHAIAVYPLDREGAPTTLSKTLIPEPGRRYTLSIQVVFDREGMPKRDGVIVVEAQMPLVVRVKDTAGTSLAEASGFIDPSAPPNVLYGQAAHESPNAKPPELAVERLVGPFMTSSNAPLSVVVDLGPDRIGTARILERRLIIHDDSLPSPIKRAFVIAVCGMIAFVTGIVLLFVGWWRTRRRRTPRQRDKATEQSATG
jgi:hypothetical protein